MADVLELIGFEPDTASNEEPRGPCPIHRSQTPGSRSSAVAFGAERVSLLPLRLNKQSPGPVGVGDGAKRVLSGSRSLRETSSAGSLAGGLRLIRGAGAGFSGGQGTIRDQRAGWHFSGCRSTGHNPSHGCGTLLHLQLSDNHRAESDSIHLPLQIRLAGQRIPTFFQADELDYFLADADTQFGGNCVWMWMYFSGYS